MKTILKLLSLCIGLMAFACASDDPEPVQPAPAEKEVIDDGAITSAADSVSTGTDSLTTDTTQLQSEQVPQTTSFPDSSFYQGKQHNDLPYQIMFPRKYDGSKKYPLVIFLHGMDERGTDNQRQLKWGAAEFKADSVTKNYPSFVVFPQCHPSRYWHDPTSLNQLKELIDYLSANHSIDKNRIYIEGLSMGAYGTYAMVAAYPDLFAAAVAISGDGDKSKADRMAKVDWKIYGGKKDTIVPGEKSEKMAEALINSGATVSVKIYPNADHVHSWINAFAESDFFSWVFSRSKD